MEQLVNELGDLSKTEAWHIDELKNKANKYYELYKVVDRKTKGRLTRAMNKAFGKGMASRGKVRPKLFESIQEIQPKVNGKKAPPKKGKPHRFEKVEVPVGSSEDTAKSQHALQKKPSVDTIINPYKKESPEDIAELDRMYEEELANTEPTPLSVLEDAADKLRMSQFVAENTKGVKGNEAIKDAEKYTKIIDEQLKHLYKTKQFKILAKVVKLLDGINTPVSDAMNKVVYLQKELKKLNNNITSENIERREAEIGLVTSKIAKVREVYAGTPNIVGDSVIKKSSKGEETLKEAVMNLIRTKSEDDIIVTTLKETTGCK